ncbi:ABC transporter substrate-binding protein [Nonomuraea sp. NEAU-A123]|uniref:ABC transporter substrate-binding protein n=1 Tax=Nonomuraea sp. NEAU-A123 TaxID=2839649 RepID=UPI001BE4AA37|nr:ABC transporter substrate-binding protein [Nonomuraea sp. NEAU-A123]MBT2224708.1 ABC transporter substrate-binding protein [Nonomuraea sp. NEAU-A123]
MKRSLPLRPSALICSALLTLTACGTFENNDSTAGADQNVVISLQFSPRSNYALETDDALLLSQIGCLETLLTYDNKAGALKPLLATKWTQSNPTTWDFTLRENVKFQDGTGLTADAVVQGLKHVLAVEAPPRAFNKTVVSSITALDGSTVRITTPKPSALLPFRLASANTGILAPAAYTSSGIKPIGHCTGPYKPVSEATGQSISMERNTTYWGGQVPLAKVEARFIAEGATRATQVQTGESQIALGIPATSVAALKSDKDLVVSETFTPRTTGLYFNNSRAPFNKAALRKAVQAALDLNAIAKSVYNNGAEPAIGPFSPTEPWAPKGMRPVAQNLDQAKALLAEAGYAPGKLKLTLLAYTERPEFADLATVIQANLKAIGIEVKVKSSDYAGIEPQLLSGDYDLTLLSRNHLVDIADPNGFLSSDYTCDGGFNISHFCDPAIDKKIASANALADATERNAVYAEVARYLEENAVTVFGVHEQTLAAYRAGVKGFTDDPLARYAITTAVTVAKQ